MEKTTSRVMPVATAPNTPGLAFRGFRGEEDYPIIHRIISGCKVADQAQDTTTLEDITRNYHHLFNCDPYQDMRFAEVNGEAVGYSRVWWQQELEGTRVYQHFAYLLPEWRGTGIRPALLQWSERRLREIAQGQPGEGPRVFEAWASDTEPHWESVLLGAGYEAIRHGFEMVRPDLENIPDLPLPEGLEVRPVQPEQIDTIWEAAREAFRDSWGETEWQQEWLDEWREAPTFQPHLWQVAWDGDQVAGMVQNFVNEKENKEFGRLRGYTEGICVRRPWRRQGLARALIARSFKVIKDLGMTEAALGVDAENRSGALNLYLSMGFQEVKRHTTYRKPLD